MIHGCLWLRGGVIAAVDSGSRIPAAAVDCDGDLVLPGLVELHTDNLEWHVQPRPGVGWPHSAAILAHDAELAGAGITTVFDAIRVGSLLQGSVRYDRYARPLATEVLALRAAGALKISHRLHLRAEICSDTLPDELAEFSPADDVGVVSLMDHTPGQRQFRDINKLAGYVMARHQMTKGQFADHVAQLQALSARVAVGHRAVALAEAARIGAV